MNDIVEKDGFVRSITPVAIQEAIASEHYFTAAQGVVGNVDEDATDEQLKSLDLLTICVLILRNGFTVTGESACARPDIFNAEKGREVAREKAVEKVWPLLGYELKQKLYEQKILLDQISQNV